MGIRFDVTELIHPFCSMYIFRNPDLFQVIFTFLVDGLINLVGLSDDDIQALKIEFDYFRITEGIPDSLKMNPVPAPTPVVVKWSTVNKSSYMTLSNSEMTVTKSNNVGYGGVQGELRSNRFSVRVDRTISRGGIYLGFHNGGDINWNSSFGDRWRGGYYFYPPTGEKSGGKVENSPYCDGAPIVAGDVFTVIKEGRSISFEKNEVSLGVAFTDAPEGDMFPYVELYHQNDQVTLL